MIPAPPDRCAPVVRGSGGYRSRLRRVVSRGARDREVTGSARPVRASTAGLPVGVESAGAAQASAVDRIVTFGVRVCGAECCSAIRMFGVPPLVWCLPMRACAECSRLATSHRASPRRRWSFRIRTRRFLSASARVRPRVAKRAVRMFARCVPARGAADFLHRAEPFAARLPERSRLVLPDRANRYAAASAVRAVRRTASRAAHETAPCVLSGKTAHRAARGNRARSPPSGTVGAGTSARCDVSG